MRLPAEAPGQGLKQEQLSLVILIDFPVEVFLGYYIGKWCQSYLQCKSGAGRSLDDS